MTKPATRIWCPKCYKRHRLPSGAEGMTLRCRRCKFAFRFEDGLKQKPVSNADLAETLDSLATESGSVAVQHAVGANKHDSSVATVDSPFDFENDYDDILDVLETPEDDPLAPPRAFAKKGKDKEKSGQPKADGKPGVVTTEVAVDSASGQAEPTRQPVTREKLRSHRNARQLWMLGSFLFACCLGGISWLSMNVFYTPSVGEWERKILYSMGVPARWLPPLGPDEQDLLPPNHVELFGDQVAWANREDAFRDEFPDPVVADADEEGEDREIDREGPLMFDRRVPDRGQPQFAGGAPPRRDARKNRVPRGQLGNLRPNQARPAAGNQQNRGQQWSPPELSPTDIQMASTRGIDPKTLTSISIDSLPNRQVAVTRDAAFAIGSGSRLSAVTFDSKSVVSFRKLNKRPAAICAAAEDGISNRSAMWTLFKNGQFDKWELDGDELKRTIRLTLRPVANEKSVTVAASNSLIAYNRDRQLVIAEYLPTSSKILSSKSVDINGRVRALRISNDEKKLLAVIDDEVLLIDPGNAKVQSRSKLPEGFIDASASGVHSVAISPDLSTLFACRSGFIDTLDLDSQNSAGQYWSSVPLPIRGVVVDNDHVLGFSDSRPVQATLFKLSQMERETVKQRPVPKKSGWDDFSPIASKRKLLADGLNSPDVDKHAHMTAYSPKLGARIKSLKMVRGNRIVFLTDETPTNRIGVASWDGGWRVVTLKPGVPIGIDSFAVTDDLTRIVVAAGPNVQALEIVDWKTGETKRIAEYAGHLKPVSKVEFAADGEHVVSSDESGKLVAWDFNSGDKTGGITGFKSAIVGIQSRGNGGFVAMDRRAIGDGSVSSKRDRVTDFRGLLYGATALSQNGSHVAFISGGEVKVARIRGEKIVGQFKPAENVQTMAFTEDQSYLLIQGTTEVGLWDWRQGERSRRFRLSGLTKAGPFAQSPDGSTVAVVLGENANQIGVFGLPDKRE